MVGFTTAEATRPVSARYGPAWMVAWENNANAAMPTPRDGDWMVDLVVAAGAIIAVGVIVWLLEGRRGR